MIELIIGCVVLFVLAFFVFPLFFKGTHYTTKKDLQERKRKRAEEERNLE